MIATVWSGPCAVESERGGRRQPSGRRRSLHWARRASRPGLNSFIIVKIIYFQNLKNREKRAFSYTCLLNRNVICSRWMTTSDNLLCSALLYVTVASERPPRAPPTQLTSVLWYWCCRYTYPRCAASLLIIMNPRELDGELSLLGR